VKICASEITMIVWASASSLRAELENLGLAHGMDLT
jgi:hypothetical protein